MCSRSDEDGRLGATADRDADVARSASASSAT